MLRRGVEARRGNPMASTGIRSGFGFGTALMTVLGITAWCAPVIAGPVPDDISLAAHRAIYDLKLADTRGKRALEAVRGRILYDFSGNACEGYALQFRQVTELDSGEGKIAMSDLRSTTWEDGDAKSFRFNSQNYLDQKLTESVDGKAERQGANVTVTLVKPEPKKVDFGAVTFPSEQMRMIIAAARAGKSLLEVTVYDGSENGEKLYQSLAVIGRKIEPGERNPTDAAAGQSALATVARWPVTVSYFEKSADKGGTEQTPAYSLAFELYENGISRALVLDYGDFSVSGEMTTLEVKDTKPCR
jgi:hypothetical protein